MNLLTVKATIVMVEDDITADPKTWIKAGDFVGCLPKAQRAFYLASRKRDPIAKLEQYYIECKCCWEKNDEQRATAYFLATVLERAKS